VGQDAEAIAVQQGVGADLHRMQFARAKRGWEEWCARIAGIFSRALAGRVRSLCAARGTVSVRNGMV
jgi:hypothetical protein